MPTLPTVKLRPSRVSGMVSSCLGFLLDFVDRCLRTSVLFFARRKELGVFLLVEMGTDLFLVCPRLVIVSGVFIVVAELASVRVWPPKLVAWVLPMIWLTTAGSMEMIEA